MQAHQNQDHQQLIELPDYDPLVSVKLAEYVTGGSLTLITVKINDSSTEI